MRSLDRRRFLRGTGAFCALPFLEAFAPNCAGGAGTAPRRLVFVYVPNGIHMPDWRPEIEGAEYLTPWILEPFEALRDDIQVISGLTHDKARSNGDGPGDHARASAAFLTAAQPFKSTGDRIYVGESADQVAAKAIGGATALRSLELGCEPGRRSGQCDSGYACVYSGSVAWANATTPLMKETNPRAVFDRMFRGFEANSAREKARRKSVLDLVRADAQRLRNRLGVADRRRIDEYLNGVREVERRIERSEAQSTEQNDVRRPDEPADYAEHIDLMNELIVLALAGDVTRVVTFMHADEGSNRTYPMIEVYEGHHATSHHGNEAGKVDKIRRINRWHAEAHARLLQRLRETPAGEGNLLDASMVVYGSGISDGNRHDHADLPILLAGRGGGSLHPGVHRVVPRETPAANLWLSLLERMGVERERLGDSTGRLEEI